MSAPEVIESDYSPEKASALTSPASPDEDDSSKNSSSQSDPNETSLNGNLPTSPVEFFPQPMRLDCDENNTNEEFNAQNRHDVSLNLNQVSLGPSTSNWVDSPITEPANDIGDCVGISPSTSLIVNSELTPEGATISSMSSPITSKDSPISSPSSIIDEKIDVEKNPSQPLPPETRSPGWNLFENDTLPNVMNETQSLNETSR